MSYKGLDPVEQLRWLHEFRQLWGKVPEGEPLAYPGDAKDRWWMAEVVFRVEYCRVLATIYVGPKGGVVEQVTVVDDSEKSNELDHLWFVQQTQGSNRRSSGLLNYKMGRGDRPTKLARAMQLLAEEVHAARTDTAKYVQKLRILERTETESSDGWLWQGGAPRT